MKIRRIFPRHLLLFTLVLLISPCASGQLLKKLGKRAEQAAERAVERRVDKETTEKTDEVLDSILEPGKKVERPDSPVPKDSGPVGDTPDTNPGQTNAPEITTTEQKDSDPISVYSKFDFVPGDKLLFFDDFSNDFIGDFPSKWNTNGGGEVVKVGDYSDSWLEFIPGYGIYYIPDIPSLPDEYTIEFDLLTIGLDTKTSSTAGFLVALSDDSKFDAGANFVNAWLPSGQYGAFDIKIKNNIKGVSDINSNITADIRDAIRNRPHIAIAVNKTRYRLWVNEKKYVDIPRVVPSGKVLNTLKFNISNLIDDKEHMFITNLKIAEGGLDLRRILIAEGKVSTNGILFDSGSASIQRQSMGIILQIAQVLQQETAMKLKIVGHTDADGNDTTNLDLSKQRADAVKNALVSTYSIQAARLQTEGKGEVEPISDNTSVDGKAQNRRVEFIKQ